MQEKKQDLRVQKTQRALAIAMLSLLETVAFGKITVRDLCTEAMISRSAFYSHFEDKYALLQFCMELLRERIFDNCLDLAIEAQMERILGAILSNKRVFKNLIGSEIDTELTDMMRRAFQRDLEDKLTRNGVPAEDLPGSLDIVTMYYAGGITSAVMHWISKKDPDSVEEMTKLLLHLLPVEQMRATEV